ncbi:MAG: response regulator [Magnetococcales bacterium]|nr:response regulator [Magnetococcales bacterium]
MGPSDNPEGSDYFVTTTQAARLLGISPRTIHYWLDRGVIKAWKTVGKHRRIPMSSVNQLLADRARELRVSERSSLTLLMVEDDEDLRNLSKRVVAGWGLPVRLVVAENGFDGLIQAGLHQPEIIITDLMMPSMDGYKMIKKLKSTPELRQSRIIVVTGLDEQEIAANGSVLAGIKVFRKPTPYDLLQAVVRDVLRDRGHVGL